MVFSIMLMKQHLGEFSLTIHCNAVTLFDDQRVVGWFPFDEVALAKGPFHPPEPVSFRVLFILRFMERRHRAVDSGNNFSRGHAAFWS